MLRWIGVLVLGYILGSVPFGFLIVRWVRGIDIREIGSGRTGGTNVLRAAGWKMALSVIVMDIMKGTLAVLVARWLDGPPLVQALAGVMAIVGHNYSIFLRFRGGAGAMTAVGGAMALWLWSSVILLLAGLVVVLSTRYASMGSITLALLIPIILAIRAAMGLGPWDYLTYGLLAALLIVWTLRPNIQRLLRGEERRVDLGGGRARG
jgi:glycerol-3-phosphate acyltransferase PlsY